ncbi:MAG: D-alanine--D-alanine ligase A [Firmicutes bacterium HGW-Firmicutes-3]|jgi:D-alanine-D-alanine ligase|nr:MAG: D-alanine--D-alanine ligase A [Firmicutes bacterium HGW-Firmicutes-3]
MKQNVVVIFGGQSTEHDISKRSVLTFLGYMDENSYEVKVVGITREGKWLLVEGGMEDILSGAWEKSNISATLLPDATLKSLLIQREEALEYFKVDVVIPVLHGLYGEDGSIQGLLKLAKIPFVGCGVLASAVSMDKFYTKLVVEPLGIRQAKYIGVYEESYNKEAIKEKVENKLGYPVFVKPSNAGSSIGVSKAIDKATLHEALLNAFIHDRKVLIEENIQGREVECAVIGNLEVKASDVGEILSADEFYDFDSKYNNPQSKTILSADMPEATRQQIREAAVAIFKAVDGRGLSRVDFFIENHTGEVVFNEINTFPGFTDISMYPMLIEAEGITKSELIDHLIQLAIDDCV